jgi:hypothetical protein
MVYPKHIEWQGGVTAHGKRVVSGLSAVAAPKPATQQTKRG